MEFKSIFSHLDVRKNAGYHKWVAVNCVPFLIIIYFFLFLRKLLPGYILYVLCKLRPENIQHRDLLTVMVDCALSENQPKTRQTKRGYRGAKKATVCLYFLLVNTCGWMVENRNLKIMVSSDGGVNLLFHRKIYEHYARV